MRDWLPDEITLKLVRPPEFAELDDNDFNELAVSRVPADESDLRARSEVEGKSSVSSDSRDTHTVPEFLAPRAGTVRPPGV